MTTVALNRETSHYWDYIKNASNETKLTLITLLSSSMAAGEEVAVVKPKPLKARRLSQMSNEQMEREMQGAPVPITADSETSPDDIVRANQGRMAKGLEKWL